MTLSGANLHPVVITSSCKSKGGGDLQAHLSVDCHCLWQPTDLSHIVNLNNYFEVIGILWLERPLKI